MPRERPDRCPARQGAAVPLSGALLPSNVCISLPVARRAFTGIQAILIAAFSLQAAPQEVSPLANSHPDYTTLRNAEPQETFAVRDLTLVRDVGVIRLAEGKVTVLAPVLNATPIAVFHGSGEFALEPATDREAEIIDLYIDGKSVEEPFREAVFCFTDGTAAEIRNSGIPTS